MAAATTGDFATENSSPFVKETASSADIEVLDTSVIAGVIAAVVITVLVVLTLIAIYLYKHKGSYRTHEMIEDRETDEAFQSKTDDRSEEKQEYFM